MRLAYPFHKPSGFIVWVWRVWKGTRAYKWGWRMFKVFPYRLKREWAWNHGEEY